MATRLSAYFAERLRPGGNRAPVVVAWGVSEGHRVLLHLMAGPQ